MTPHLVHITESVDPFFNGLSYAGNHATQNEIVHVHVIEDETDEEMTLAKLLLVGIDGQEVGSLTLDWRTMDELAASWLLARNYMIATPGAQANYRLAGLGLAIRPDQWPQQIGKLLRQMFHR